MPLDIPTLRSLGLDADQVMRVWELVEEDRAEHRAEVLALADDLAGYRESGRQRARRYRERKTSIKTNGASRDASRYANSPMISRAGAPARAPAPLLPTEGRFLTPISIDWRPNSNGLLLADQLGFVGAQLEEEIERFRNHYLSEGKELADWQPRWLNWLKSPHRKNGGSTYVGPTKKTCASVIGDLLDKLGDTESGARGVHPETGSLASGVLPPRRGG